MAYATFADLPPEMVGNVFAFIRSKSHQSSVCLVSRTWRDQIRPIMWEKIETNFRDASASSLATLLHPQSGITGHIRELDICESAHTIEGENHVILVITAIPRDRLRRFESTCKVSPLTFQVLLQSQRKMEEIDIWSSFSTPGQLNLVELDSEEHHTWIGPLLSKVSTISLYINRHEAPANHISNGMKIVSHYCPKIRDLSLDAALTENPYDVSVCAILAHAKDQPIFPNLTFLRLFELKVAANADQPIHESLNLSNLKGLQIVWCIDHISLLEGIASFYTRNTGQLEELIVTLPVQMNQPKRTVQAIDTLLKTCPKLTELQLDLSVHGLIARNSVLAHCKTLTSLTMESGMSEGGNYFPIAEMTAILKACTKLTTLAIDMPRLELGSISEPANGFSPDEEYAHVLAAVSTQPMLKAFRILNLPVLEFDDPSSVRPTGRDTFFCQVVMQNLANQILRFATDRGSTLKVLSLKPSLEPADLPVGSSGRDTNGHKWPEYHYFRGRVSDITSTDVVVAHPSKSVTLDFPDLKPLLQYI